MRRLLPPESCLCDFAWILFGACRFLPCERATRLHPAAAGLQRGCQSNPLLWSKRVYDFLEARIAAQRIPQRAQAQVAISVLARSFDEGFKLPKRQLTFACPGTDHLKANLCVWLSGFVFDAARQFHR